MPPAKKRARVESERKSVQAGKKLPRTIRKQTLHTHDDASALDAAKRDIAEGAPPKAAASYFVHEEMHELKQGNPRIKNRAQAVAVGLAKARRAGIPVPKNPNRSSGSDGGRKKRARKA